MRKPKRRDLVPRSSDNEKRRLRDPIPPRSDLEALAARATFQGSSKHKLRPRAFGMEPYTGKAVDRTYCDGHADFGPEDLPSVAGWLARGIAAGLIGANDSQGDPSVVWVVSDDGWIYEGRITVPGRAIHHLYPVLPNEAIAKSVLGRYQAWAQGRVDAGVRGSVQACQERYR
jgi:hypothetical protein